MVQVQHIHGKEPLRRKGRKIPVGVFRDDKETPELSKSYRQLWEDNAMRREVYIVGSGGQGVVLMGALLAEAYALKNWNVVQTVVYDAAQRGGLARAEVVMSDYGNLFTQGA